MNINLTLFAQLISFAIFVWFCKTYVWPPIISAMQERQKQIADGLNAAEKAGQELEVAHRKIDAQLGEAKAQARQILDQATKLAAQFVVDAKVAALTEGQRLKDAAQSDIEQEVNRAKEQLRAQVASLALIGAEKVLEASVDEAAHKDIVNKLAANL